MIVGFVELAVSCEMLLVIVGIRDLLKVAANHRRRFVMLGHGHRFVAALSRGHKNIAAHEVHEVRALQQQLRHPGVVVVGARDVAIGAAFGFFGAHGVRHEGAEGLSAETFGGDRLLLVVEPVAIGVLRTDQHGAGGTDRRDAIAGHRAVDSQRVDVVAQDLEIVGSPVARGEAFVVQHGHALVRRHREMAAVAGRRPGGVAGVAGHLAVGVREL